ncbi:MAG: hypothetical protein K0Q60_4794 [Microvirga sp.]|jgi:hypothetical protein|nr:hypothetical protein [Microvirga sp.]
MKFYTKSPVRARGGALRNAGFPLFDWARDQALFADPAVRRLVRVRHLSPVLASVYADLLGWGGRND